MKNQKSKFLVIDHPEMINKKDKSSLTPVHDPITIPRKSFDNILSFKNNKKLLSINLPSSKNVVSICSPLVLKSNLSKRPSVTNCSHAILKNNNDEKKITKKVSINLNNRDRSQSSNHFRNLPVNNSPNIMKKLKPGSIINSKNSLFSPFHNPKKQSNIFNYKNIGQINEIINNNDTSISNNLSNPSAKSVKEYSYSEDCNKDYREYMEDFCKIIDKYRDDNSKGLFCLYDGHGGSHSVTYVKDRLPEVFTKILKDFNNNVEKALIFTFQKMDDELKLFSESQNAGTTACVVFFQREQDIAVGIKRVMYSANVGDTRALLITTKEAKRISYEHKCSDQLEADRIRKIGGIIFNGRIFGQLALSRALGDHAFKKYGVTPFPFINKHIITEKDRYVVMCSDGVWDVLTDKDIFEFSSNCDNSEELSKYIIAQAIENGSQDNVSCIVIKIN